MHIGLPCARALELQFAFSPNAYLYHLRKSQDNCFPGRWYTSSFPKLKLSSFGPGICVYSAVRLFHARLLKDSYLYRADRYSQTLSLPNTLLLVPMARGCMEIGLYASSLRTVLLLYKEGQVLMFRPRYKSIVHISSPKLGAV